MSRGTLNKAIIIGRLGKDPEMKYTPSGTAVATFSVASNHSMRDAQGGYEDKTEWHRIVVFGRQAEFAGEYLVKGKLVYVEGRIQTRAWEDKEGTKRYTTEIVANDIQLLGSRGDGETAQENAAPPVSKETNTASSVPENPPEQPSQTPGDQEEDDLPF